MCAGAAVAARLARQVYGADDPKAGAVASLFDVVRDPRLPHRVEVVRGIRADDCGALLAEFFAGRRTGGSPDISTHAELGRRGTGPPPARGDRTRPVVDSTLVASARGNQSP
jgi:hypothetical protein